LTYIPPPQVLQNYRTPLSSRPCLPCCQGSYNAAGPHRSIGITRLHHYRGPVRHPLAFGPFPGVAGYRTYLAPAISHRDEEGFSSCLACPCHRAVASTPPKWISRIDQSSAVHAPSPLKRGLGLGFQTFRGHIRVHLRYGPVTRTFPIGRLVDRLQILDLSPLRYPSYGGF